MRPAYMQQCYRHPRSMQQAFGPYTDHRLHPMPDPPSELSWTLADICIAIILLALLGAIAAGVFA